MANALTVEIASESDASELVALHQAVSDDLTRRFGKGHWTHQCSERGIVAGMSATSQVIVARSGRGRSRRIVGTLRLATKKPWAIDVSYFTPVDRALYLLDMDVSPARQRQGIGRRMLNEAMRFARAFPTRPAPKAIRLDAYDTGGDGVGAGAGGFYARCGYRDVGRVKYRGTPLIYFELLL